jgi:hypothetical protein
MNVGMVSVRLKVEVGGSRDWELWIKVVDRIQRNNFLPSS